MRVLFSQHPHTILYCKKEGTLVKKISLLLISVILLFSLVACSSHSSSTSSEPTPSPITTITASQALSLDDAQGLVTYPLVASNASDSSVTYQCDPIGQGDVISVTVSQYNEVTTKDKVRSDYDKTKAMRPTAETLEGIGDDAYIAFPTVHVYKDGYHVSVTAGSGGDQVQHDLLQKIAGIVDNNLNTLLNK